MADIVPDALPGPSAIIDALATHLADEGVAAYSPTGAYADGGLPVVVFGRMPATPDTVIVLNTYNEQTQRAGKAAPDVFVQVRCRTAGRDPRTTEQLSDTIYRLIDRPHQQWGPVTVRDCNRVVYAPIGADENGRYERADSYRAHINL